MADSRIQLEVEDWVRRNWMPTQYGTEFSRERLRLRPGGLFDFDAVSEDHSIAQQFRQVAAKTLPGKNASGKVQNLRADMLFLTQVETKRRIIVLTEQDMRTLCEKEFAAGHVPREIEFICAIIPRRIPVRHESDYLAITTVVQELLSLGRSRFAAVRISSRWRSPRMIGQ